MLGNITDLHMVPIEQAQEVPLDKYINPLLETYPNVVPANSPNLAPITVERVIKRRGPVRDRKNQSYIVTDSGTEMVTLGAGWLITKRGNMPSTNIARLSQQMSQINMYRGSGITRVNITNRVPILIH